MLRPGSIPRSSAQAAAWLSPNTSASTIPASMPRSNAVPLPSTAFRALATLLPLSAQRKARSGPPPCQAKRRSDPSQSDISRMNIDERLERLGELSGRVGEVRSIYDRVSLLREMGALDPALYATAAEDEEDEEEVEEPVWLEWEDDPREHVRSLVTSEALPDGLQRQVVMGEDAGEDEAVVQVPLHNCLVLYFTDDEDHPYEQLTGDMALEREEAVKDFIAMQLNEIARWEKFHGPLPPGLVEFLCDFRRNVGPTSRVKMALWLMWVAECCESPYWKEVLAGLPQPPEMSNLEFCSDEELYELQWLPYALPASLRRETLRGFYDYFCESEWATRLGFERRIPSEEAEAMAAAKAAEEAAAAASAAAAEAAAAAAAAGKKKGRRGAKKAPAPPPEAAPAALPAPAAPSSPALHPLPPFERFLWAYCHAEARSLGNGERIVFFPQADPFLYTTAPDRINCTLAVVADEGPTLDQFAVVATLRPVTAGEPLYANPPFGAGAADGGGGNISQLHSQFGLVPSPGGSSLEIQDLEPENGSILDDTYKRILGQEEASRLENLTDPKIRHLLGLLDKEKVDMRQLPPLKKLIPKLQLPKLWGPGLAAGVQRLKLVELETTVGPDAKLGDNEVDEGAGGEDDEFVVSAIDSGVDAEMERAAMAKALYEDDDYARTLSELRGGTPPPEVSYKEFEEWRQNPVLTNIVESPADPELAETEEGRAEWRRMVAAWTSLPRVQPSTREHRRCMELAIQGAPVEEVFPTPRDMVRELAAAETVVTSLRAILDSFATPIDYDQQLLAAASVSATPLPPPPPPPGWRDPASDPEAAAVEPEVVNDLDGLMGAKMLVDALDEVDNDWVKDVQGTGEPATAVTTLRLRGLVAWRLEQKLVWRQMVGMAEEYRDSLAAAVAAAGLAPEEEVEEGQVVEEGQEVWEEELGPQGPPGLEGYVGRKPARMRLTDEE